MRTYHQLWRVLSWSSCAVVAASIVVACGDSEDRGSNAGAGNSGAGGNVGDTADQGGMAGEGGVVNQVPGAGGDPGAGGGNAEGGASAGGGAAGAATVPCHISWTGAATGETDCQHSGVCQHSFLSIGAATPLNTAPITNVQLVFIADDQLGVGTVEATGLEIVDTVIQTDDPAVSYEPQFDPTTHLLTGGTSMAVALTSVEFSNDPNNICSGVAHGSLDAVLLQTDAMGNAGSRTLSVHADF